MFSSRKPTRVIDASDALPGRAQPIATRERHLVNGNPIKGPFGDTKKQIVFAMGCFWPAERLFWETDGVWVTAAGYAGGTTPNPTNHEVASGMTGHAEAVLVVFDPNRVSTEDLLKLFWENHDPTQGMQQGEDVGTHYRSGIYTNSQNQMDAAKGSRFIYQSQLAEAGFGQPTTEISRLTEFYYAEEQHQQYLHEFPDAYPAPEGLGVICPIGTKT